MSKSSFVTLALLVHHQQHDTPGIAERRKPTISILSLPKGDAEAIRHALVGSIQVQAVPCRKEYDIRGNAVYLHES